MSSTDYQTDNPLVQSTTVLEVKIVHPNAKAPTRTKSTDAGYDLTSVERVVLKPHSSTMVATGIRLACPPGWYYTIEGRSSLWSKGIVPNRGIIDSTYCGNLYVSLVNWNDTEYVVEPSDRIAQILLHRQHDAVFKMIEEFSSEYNQRGEAGFGSTGK